MQSIKFIAGKAKPGKRLRGKGREVTLIDAFITIEQYSDKSIHKIAKTHIGNFDITEVPSIGRQNIGDNTLRMLFENGQVVAVATDIKVLGEKLHKEFTKTSLNILLSSAGVIGLCYILLKM